MYKTTGSQHLKLKKGDTWVRHWNYYATANSINTNLYQWDAC